MQFYNEVQLSPNIFIIMVAMQKNNARDNKAMIEFSMNEKNKGNPGPRKANYSFLKQHLFGGF